MGKHDAKPKEHMVLMGFMGSGKTTVGSTLATMLSMEQVDVDQAIEEKAGMSIGDIFQLYGEETFREMEKEMVAQLSNQKEPTVICSGGGVVLHPENVNALQKTGTVVWLKASPEEIYRRIKEDTGRPLLKDSMSVEKITSMLRGRLPLYEKAAHLVVETDGKNTETISREIMAGMKTIVKVKHLALGSGRPKICVPMMGASQSDLESELVSIKILRHAIDLVEWRVDYFQHANEPGKVIDALKIIREHLPETPLLFTFRTLAEGGKGVISNEGYQKLYEKVVASKMVDLIDLELFLEASLVSDVVKTAKKAGCKVVISNHDFNKTPVVEEMVNQLQEAREMGADIPKLAVMPKDAADVLALQEATRMASEDLHLGPLITMSMGTLGMISRISGHLFGSCLTFGAATVTSAPGQIPVEDLYHILEVLYD